MKLKHIVANICKEQWNSRSVDSDPFIEYLSISSDGDWNKLQTRLNFYYFASWYCTDSYVGLGVYYLDDQPVAISSQTGRKSDENIEFVSIEAAKKLKQWFVECNFVDPEPELPIVSDPDWEEDLGEGYNIEFVSQLYHFNEKVNQIHTPSGQKVKSLKSANKNQLTNEKVNIELFNGSKVVCNISDIEFGFAVK